MARDSSRSDHPSSSRHDRKRKDDRNGRNDRSKRSRSRSRDRDRKRKNDGGGRVESSSSKKGKGLDLGEIVKSGNLDLAQQKLEEEMRIRRERIEKWRQERKLKAETEAAAANLLNDAAANGDDDAKAAAKMWSLDDEDEDDDETAETSSANGADAGTDDATVEEAKANAEDDTTEVAGDTTETGMEVEEQEDIDPLDAFMQEVNKDVRKQLNRNKKSGDALSQTKVTVVTKKFSNDSAKFKGVVVEQNADAVEYSDEEKDFDIDSAVSLATKAKRLAATDHSMIYYRPFERNFYVEVPELAKMTDAEVDKRREELEHIKVRGKNCVKPVRGWAQCGFEWTVLDALKKAGYDKPTPIQAQAVPAVMSGRDVIGIAKTGSGKTLAFVLPMLRHIKDQPELEEMDGPIVLVMSPTRELALQTAKECRRLCRPLSLTVACVYGGAGISEQIAELKRGVHVVVCTPGRMIDMLAANNGRVTNLRRVTYLVLDEADRMFDMGFEPQVMRLLGNIRPDRQTVLFSATFPRQMEALARKILVKPIEIQVGGRSVVCKDIEQHIVICEEHQKLLKLLELLGVYFESGSVLVFVEKQERADEIIKDLMDNGYRSCAPLHGGIDQFDRDSTILDFKKGVIKVLVATSVAARGLDVKKLILVVNYDCPNHYEDYVHRVGRTGRAGNQGYAYTFILPETQERYAGEIVRALELSATPVPDDLRKLWDDFKAKMAEEGHDVKFGGGFGGSGYRFDEAEAELVSSKKKMDRLVHGIEAGADADDDDEIEQQIQSIMKSKKSVKRSVAGGVKPNTAAGGVANAEALEKAKALARQIQLNKNLGPGAKDSLQQTTEAVLKGGVAGTANISARAVAQQLASQLNDKLNYIPSELAEKGVAEADEYQYFEEELEINDFPQQVRWKVCSRETMSNILDASDVGVSVKGSYYPHNKEPKEGQDRRLYIHIEATSELALNRAKAEIIRVIKEAFKQLATQGNRQQTGGRYKVL